MNAVNSDDIGPLRGSGIAPVGGAAGEGGDVEEEEEEEEEEEGEEGEDDDDDEGTKKGASSGPGVGKKWWKRQTEASWRSVSPTKAMCSTLAAARAAKSVSSVALRPSAHATRGRGFTDDERESENENDVEGAAGSAAFFFHFAANALDAASAGDGGRGWGEGEMGRLAQPQPCSILVAQP